MSFGWSAGDVVAGLQLLNRIRIALNDSGGSRSEYQDETAFLDNLSLTLRALGSVQPGSLQPAVAGNISRHAEHIRKSVDRFLQDVQAQFGPDLGRFPTTTRRAMWGASVSALRKMQWALSTSKKVRALRDRIGAELLSLQIQLSQHLINICTQMPADIQCQMEHVIKSTLDDYWQTNRSLLHDGGTKASQEGPVAEEHNVKHLDRLLRDLEGRASRIAGGVHRVDILEHGPVEIDHKDREKRTQFDRHLNQVSSVLGRVEQLHNRLEACALLRDPADPSASMRLSENVGLGTNNSETPELFLQSVDNFLDSAFKVVRTVIYIITLAMITGYSRLVLPLFSRIRILRIAASAENGLTLIDALGRVGILPYGCGRSWSTIQKILEIWFEGFPGQDLVQKGMYCLGDPRRPNDFFTEEAWSYFVQDGSTAQMQMVLGRCRACGNRLTYKGATQTAVCQACHDRCPVIDRSSFRYGPKVYHPSMGGSRESITLKKLAAARPEAEEAASAESILQLRALKHVLYYGHSSCPVSVLNGYQVIELYSVCRCVYYRHAADLNLPGCVNREAFDKPGYISHNRVAQRTILVGNACIDHPSHSGQY